MKRQRRPGPWIPNRVLSARFGGVGHAEISGIVLCGALRLWYIDQGAKFSERHDCQRCATSLAKLRRGAAHRSPRGKPTKKRRRRRDIRTYRRIGQRIKARRIDLCVTAKELARKLRVSKQHMSSIETGKYSASLRLVMQIAAILEVEPGEFINTKTPRRRCYHKPVPFRAPKKTEGDYRGSLAAPLPPEEKPPSGARRRGTRTFLEKLKTNLSQGRRG